MGNELRLVYFHVKLRQIIAMIIILNNNNAELHDSAASLLVTVTINLLWRVVVVPLHGN